MWVVILLGVEISYVWQNLYGVLRASEQQIADDPRYDVYYAIRALLEVCRRFDRREDAPSSYRLAEQFSTTDSQMLRVLQRLEDVKLVKEVGGDWPGYLPACDPDRIMIEEVITQVEGSHRLMPDVTPDDRERTAIGEVIEKVNACTVVALEHLSVGQLMRSLYSPRMTRREDSA
jgi:DNA-binding IscR family transcriptional regulator